MRAVKKGGGHYHLNLRHASYLGEIAAGTAAAAAVSWNNFAHKEETRHACWHEQFGLCAFSETALDNNDLGMHLDHVEPKSLNQARTFDHANLLLCAIDSDRLKGMAKSEVFGGHYRKDGYHAADFVTPLWADCRRFFHYTSSGEIEPAFGLSADDARKAYYTISILNLNAPILVRRRRRWLEELELEIDNLLHDPDVLRHFAEVELCDTQGRLRPFHSAVRDRFGHLGEDTIALRCPVCV
jgi:uncharacterized protein (TIGR02646 family)